VGRRRRNASRSRCYRQLEKLECDLLNERRRAERFKQRYHRLVKKMAAGTPTKCHDTPRTKTRKLLRHWSTSHETVKRTLIFHNAVLDDLRARYAACKSKNAKRKMANLVMGRTVRKCKMQMLCCQSLGFSKKMSTPKVRQRVCSSTPWRYAIRDFFVRDDVSRITSGKKETVTRDKTKEQKRYLCDDLLNLHRKFLSENPQFTVSYAMFCRLRPFFVLLPTLRGRETCCCRQHENLQMIANKLVKLHLIKHSNIEDLADSCTCSSSSKSCMYGICPSCIDKTVELPVYDTGGRVECDQWNSVEEERTNKKGHSVTVKVTKKERVTFTLQELVLKFKFMLFKFRKHIFNIRHQFAHYRKLKGSLAADECIIHVDFAENYSCKHFSEIQSVHFGASHDQATLHDGIFYVRNGDKMSVTSFCTISNSRAHDPAAIWVYMEPILKLIRQQYPAVQTLHFYSDGPCTQYRQKCNFFLFCTKLFDLGFRSGSWNFSEAGHGKGPADGIGGAIKRCADRLVSLYCDITSAEILYNKILQSQTHIKLFYVDASTVAKACAELAEKSVNSVPGTMRIHQILTTERGKIKFRDVSCFCSDEKLSCDCYDIISFCFIDDFTCDEASDSACGGQSECVECGPQSSVITNIEQVSESMVGKHCLVKYDGRLYPGKILKVDVNDNDCLVQCMHKIGVNRYFWPTFDDTTWYDCSDIIAIVPEPTPIGRFSRHFMMTPEVWAFIMQWI